MTLAASQLNRLIRNGAKFLPLIALIGVLAACGLSATPIVIRDTNSADTLTARVVTVTATGATLTPTMTATQYIRPTDDPALNLTTPLVRIGDETITLGQFRARVRYERFAALNDARRMIEQVGLAKANLATPGDNPVADTIASIFNTLANSEGFGYQIYNNMVRESIIRQEFNARKLALGPTDVRGYWDRYFNLQKETNIDVVLPKDMAAFYITAGKYSGLTRDEIDQVVTVHQMGVILSELIGREKAVVPDVLEIKAHAIIATTQADADSAVARLKNGEAFRIVACQFSTDPTVHGKSGDLGFQTRSQFTPGLDTETIFKANIGDIVGPLQTSLGWHLFKINAKKANADGDTLVSVQTILVGTQVLAADILNRARAGEDFGTLACMYSLDTSGGTGGDLGYIGVTKLPDEVGNAIKASTENKLFGPIQTQGGLYVISVEDRRVNIPRPEDVDKMRAQAFNDWQEQKAASSYVSTLSDVWQKAIPGDPLPRDVSPLMREENLGLPTPKPTPTQTPTPSPGPSLTPVTTPTPMSTS